jgi:membrane-associated protease RseP (regulator of RpoE activity)
MSQLQDLELHSSTARVVVQPLARRRARRERYWLYLLLLVATLLSTMLVGAQLENNFRNGLPLFSLEQGLFPLRWIAAQPSRLLLGMPFALTLMAILLAHELGHYLACRRYGVDASLPFFIPAPTLIGTMGAFIRIRSPIPSRNALFDIGIAGPVAGFVLALPALLFGLTLSRYFPSLAHGSDLQLNYPASFHLFGFLIPGAGHHSIEAVVLHPIAIAAWIGMFATALNLLPGGQLDGGHILYALFPGAHKLASRTLLVLLLLMSPFVWFGWLLWAVVLAAFGRHPYVPQTQPLGRTRTILAGLALLMLLLSFTPVPFVGAALDWHATFGTLRAGLQRLRGN